MCSRVRSAAAARRSSSELRRFLRSSSSSNSSSSSSSSTSSSASGGNVAGPARRHCSRTDSTLTTGSWLQILPSRTPPVTCLGQGGRGFMSRPRSAEVITTTKLSLAGGTMTVNLPLPGLPGLTAVSVPEDIPVRDLVEELMTLDKSLSRVDVANADGNKVAACTAMADVASRGLLISLGGRPHIRVVSEVGDHGAEQVPAPEIYALVRTEIISAGRVTLTRDGLDALFAKVNQKACPEDESGTLDPMLADGWLNALVEDGLVFTADKGRVVLLNPSGPGLSDEIASALRRDDQLIDLKVSRLRAKLDGMYAENGRLESIRDTLLAKAHRNVTLKKGAVLAFMTAQFSTLAYCVYEVYSWDVMEPATYFLMLSYSVGSSLYFSANNREASFENLEDEAIKKREAKLKPVHGYSRTLHKTLKEDIKRYEGAVKLLSSHRDAHPPMQPSLT